MALHVAQSSARCGVLPQRQTILCRTYGLNGAANTAGLQHRQTQLAALPYRSTTTAPRYPRRDFAGFEDVDGAPLLGKGDEWLLPYGSDMGADPYFNVPKPMPVIEEPKFVNGKSVQVNNDIKARQVRLLGVEREDLGVVHIDEARAMAEDEEVDVVLITADADPPVARLIPFSKYKFEMERAAKQRQKAAKTVDMKEVRIRPVTEDHDYQVKLKNAQKFLSKGNKVKLVMTFSGRELRFKEQGRELILKFVEELSVLGKVDGPLNFKAATYSVLMTPLK